MHIHLQAARELFLHVVGKLPMAQWEGYVAEACGGNADLAQQVACLLQVHREAGSFLESPAIDLTSSLDQPSAELLGTQIGPYKLRELLAEGGMGSVYVAEQEHPVRRKVALKVIKPGMDSRQVLSRFEAERQTLARMDHPHIAKVLDAGTTDSGRPYFVMELVKGVPITEFCDQRRLEPRERLSLFVQVCRAIQHAHQKGIIHRDIKPSNILVTLHDDQAVPVVIDFGIAKAIDQQLTEQTVYTAFNQLVGSPLYMSPEQAEMNALDVDTRSDVYSLGVLLYELLTGSTPFESDTFREAGFDEMRRMIREVDPPRPSQRISSLALRERAGVRETAKVATTIAEHRGVDQRRLHRALAGDLDWIVMKALEKDRNRRYESASALAADVQRHLDGEPIQARPPRLFAAARKWCRRHQTATTASAVAAILLLMFATGMAADRRRQTRETRFTVETSLAAARKALQANDVDQAATRLSEAQARIDAARLRKDGLVEDVEKLGSEVERYRSFQGLYSEARHAMTGPDVSTTPADAPLEMYKVIQDPNWLHKLQLLELPEEHVARIRENVYELLLLRADYLTRWSGHWPKKTRQARLEIQSREAITCLERAVAFHAKSRGYYWLLANSWLHLDDREKERRLRATAMETPPHDAAELFYITRDRQWGTVSQYRGYPAYTIEECCKDHREMLRLDPTYYNAMYFMALRLEEHRRYAEALVGWYGCFSIYQDELAAVLHRGIAHSRLGQFEEANRDIDAVLASRPENPTALEEVAFFLATEPSREMRDGARAVQLAERGCKLTQYKAPGMLDALACGYAEIGNFDSAVKWSELAVELCDTSRLDRNKKHLESFRQNKPWREE